ncbi:MAG: helix-turn-helix domain-containing protein [Planctomycetes bacterium]|nr:helix-turn-helix domain-containing protein [Planctomycetota bacterium]
MPKVLDELAALIRRDGRTIGALSRETGIAKSAISRLLRKERGLMFESAETLARALGHTIELKPSPRLKKRSKP